MWREGPPPDLIAVNSAISACASSNRWEEALQLGAAGGTGEDEAKTGRGKCDPDGFVWFS